MSTILHKSSQRGQALLMLLLMIALVMTVIASVSYRLTTETQTTKSQEENIRVLAAADSGIERGINLANNPGFPQNQQVFFNNPAIGFNNIPGINAARSNIMIQNTSENTFVSSDVLADDQFTFYLWNYPEATARTYYTQNMILYFGSNGAGSCAVRNAPALEVTIIFGVNSDLIERILVEPCVGGLAIGGPNGPLKILAATQPRSFVSGGITTNFAYHTEGNIINLAAYPQAKVMIVRSLFANSRIGFSTGTGVRLPNQGKLITSEAVSNTGVSKIVSLYQSFPQIPADFFVTTF